jgi:apolipoprotein N-acyltransferase
MSIFFIPIGFFINKKSNFSSIHFPLIAASIWVLMEIIRSSLFGGFPWLLVGTSQVGTIFDSLYPFMGLYSVSFMVVIISTVMVSTTSYQIKFRVFKIYALFISFLFLIINIIPIQSTDSHQPIKVSVIQPNIHLGLKYNESQLENIKKKKLMTLL